MKEIILAYDLGTGGCKASVYNTGGVCLVSSFRNYPTYYPRSDWHEQRPDDWWNAIRETTDELLNDSRIKRNELSGLAISGHSLGAVPIGNDGELLREYVPIWSDRRAVEQADSFFSRIPERDWYELTGNGFARECYPLFKTMWYKENEPAVFLKIKKILGTKDYINFLLTGEISTDFSYASGTGIYNLQERKYSADIIEASGLSSSFWPEPGLSSRIIGKVTSEASNALGLPHGLPVCCGGVDNSCMALGAGNLNNGQVYLSLGSSAWIAVSTDKPVLDWTIRPFVFDHVVPGLYTSATSIFAAGSSLKWFVNNFCIDLLNESKAQGTDVYDYVSKVAEKNSSTGANGVIFNPTFAGGPQGDPRSLMEGFFKGLNLGIKRADIIQSVFEGIALDLAVKFQELKTLAALKDELWMVGGGSKNPYWLQIFADVLNTKIIKGTVDQEAGSLGAAAIAAVGVGLWKDYSVITKINTAVKRMVPIGEKSEKYVKILQHFKSAYLNSNDLKR